VLDHSRDLAAAAQKHSVKHVTHILNCNNNLPYWEIMSTLIAPQGSICLLSSTGQPIDLDRFMDKSVTICWELMYTRSLYGTDDMGRQRDILNRIADMVESGLIRSTLTRCLGPLSTTTAASAHEILENRTMIGKLVMTEIS
jgi:NADPH:quinone reductase-like Zn-dependent oxidoreductase